jgi:hypothetical protein
MDGFRQLAAVMALVPYFFQLRVRATGKLFWLLRGATRLKLRYRVKLLLRSRQFCEVVE